MRQILWGSIGILFVLMAFIPMAMAQEPAPGTKEDNACYEGGAMWREKSGEGCTTPWHWTCGWYLARFLSKSYNLGGYDTSLLPDWCMSLLPPPHPITQEASLPIDCGIFFNGGYTLCVQGNYLRQDSGNDGTFEDAWHIMAGTLAGFDGFCPVGSIFSGSEVSHYMVGEPAFYGWLISKGFGPFDDFCVVT